MRWTELTTDEWSALGPGWRIVEAAEVFDRLPSLRPQVLKRRFLAARCEDGASHLLLRLPRGWAALGDERFPVAAVAEYQRAWVLALTFAPGEPAALGTPPLPPAGPAVLRWADGWPELDFAGVRLGCAMRPDSRDWTWAWSRTIGPVLLRMYLLRSAAEIERWVRAHGGWELHADGQWRSPHSADSRLAIGPGYLRISRGYLSPPDAQVAADHFLLLALADGALGELVFDLFDGDYYVFQASGESCASLRDYLHARGRRDRRHRWNAYPEPGPMIDARADSTDETARLMALGLNWQCADLDALCAALRRACVPQLPRSIRVLVREAACPAAIRQRLAGAQPRVQFHFQFAPDRPAAA